MTMRIIWDSFFAASRMTSANTPPYLIKKIRNWWLRIICFLLEAEKTGETVFTDTDLVSLVKLKHSESMESLA